MQISVFAVPAPQDIIPQTGTINAHDLQNLKYQQIEHQVEQDYKNYEKRKKDKEPKPEKVKKQKDKVIKAKAEECATKGVYVENIEVTPSQILKETEITDIIEEYTQTNVSLERLLTLYQKQGVHPVNYC